MLLLKNSGKYLVSVVIVYASLFGLTSLLKLSLANDTAYLLILGFALVSVVRLFLKAHKANWPLSVDNYANEIIVLLLFITVEVLIGLFYEMEMSGDLLKALGYGFMFCATIYASVTSENPWI